MDNFDDKNGHVPAALLNRFHEAKIREAPSVTVWEMGTPLREFMYVDLANACIFLTSYNSIEPTMLAQIESQ